MAALVLHPWRGNVRELRNASQRLAVRAVSGPLTRAVVEAELGLRKSKDLDPAEIERACEATGGDLDAMSALLEVSKAELRLRLGASPE